jgi:hypothetical protein
MYWWLWSLLQREGFWPPVSHIQWWKSLISNMSYICIQIQKLPKGWG